MHANWMSLGCLLAVILVGPSPAGEAPAARPAPFRVVGYLPEYRTFDPAAAVHLTDLILFSAEPTEAGGLDLRRMRRMPWADLRAFKTRHPLRLLLCVGGGGRSAHFPAVAGSDAKRAAFVRSAVRVCLDERLDGIDLDWEHPRNEAEQTGYASLMGELREAFRPHGLTLSAALAGWQKLPPKAFAALDWVHVMAYDHPGRHATFEAAQADVRKLSAAGAPASKLTLGLPFYGRNVTNPDREAVYRDIVAKHRPGPDVDEIDGMYFNGRHTIARKTAYALEQGLAGVMVWELGQDAAGSESLLKEIRAVVDRPRR
ncbi:MAG: glycoside hydrolase family 18 protein [Gemmataceae bacterium]